MPNFLTLEVATPGLAELMSGLKQFHSDQVPFALSVAMNRAAKDAVDRVRRDLPRTFDLRSRSLARTFGPTGRMGDVSRGWSSKRQWPNLKVVLHSQARAMALQEEGGIKPFRASDVWIGTSYLPRSGTTGKVRFQRHQPARLRRRLASERQRGATRIFERARTVFERNRRTGQTVPLYIRRDRARVPERLGYERTVRSIYAAKLSPRFQQAMEKANRTRRTR
ncbi:MAG: hypothetical protein AAGB93_00685 [Planctomycetota bacterium]